MAEEKLIGEVSHFFGNISVAIIKLSDELRVGDMIRIRGANSDIEQAVDSLQIDHENVESGNTGQEVGLKVEDKVRVGDEVYKITD
jgi:putative protease